MLRAFEHGHARLRWREVLRRMEHHGNPFVEDSKTVSQSALVAKFLQPAWWFIDVFECERQLVRPV